MSGSSVVPTRFTSIKAETLADACIVVPKMLVMQRNWKYGLLSIMLLRNGEETGIVVVSPLKSVSISMPCKMPVHIAMYSFLIRFRDDMLRQSMIKMLYLYNFEVQGLPVVFMSSTLHGAYSSRSCLIQE